MQWEQIKDIKGSVFKRLVGVHKETFSKMVEEIVRLKPASSHKVSGNKRGPKPKLIVEDQLLMMLMYYREYRTFLHISADYGISEAQCWRIITELEELLIKSKLFHLPGKKALQQGNTFEIVLVDVAETPIERPKKNKENTIQGRKKGIH
jgi:Helix-turn-helix of DDE superfamily endonuclease